jgi:hypothetical protein
MPTRCNRWIFIADLIVCSTCFRHHYAHHQELKSIIQAVAACCIWCLVLQVVGMVWSWGLCPVCGLLLKQHGGEGNSLPFSTVYRSPAQQVGMLPWHWPHHKRRGYRTITVVLAKHKNGSLMMVPAWTETCRSDRRNFNGFNIPVIL